MNHTTGKKVAVCWSGGKDGCLALYRVLKDRHHVACLLSMVSGKDGRNHAHGLPLDIIKLQAQALDLPLILVDSAGQYEQSLHQSFVQIKEQYGVEAIVFGSLYELGDREWNEDITYRSGMEPLFPVWTSPSDNVSLLKDFMNLGFDAIVCRASDQYFDHSWAGRRVDKSFFKDIHKVNVCVMGEAGEYHTFVVDGPIFQQRVEITQSEVVLNAGLWSLDIQACRLREKE